MLGLVREDRLSPVDKEEQDLAGELSRGGADGPQHGLKLTEPTPSIDFELFLEAPCLKAPWDLRVGALGLAVAPWVRHRSVAYLRSNISAICPKDTPRYLQMSR